MHALRVDPLPPNQLTHEQQEFLAPFTNRSGRYPNVFGVLAHHLDLAEAWSGFGMYTLRENQLEPAHRETLILRTAILIKSDYEWQQHRRIALSVGMTEETLETIRNNQTHDDEHLQLMQTCANELISDHKLSDDTWHLLMSQFDLTYVLDAIFTVGAYSTLAMALNSCGVQLEDHD